MKLHVLPGSSKSIFPAGYNNWRNSIEIKVKSQAKDNKANIEVINKIAEYLNIPLRDILIISGQKNREKTVAINNLQIDEIYNKIQGSLNGL